jgi:hypothetical protein
LRLRTLASNCKSTVTMSSEAGLRRVRNSGRLEVLTGAALFLLSAAWVFWQNRRAAVLWDLSYLLDSAWRFRLGQLPYRELPFAHAPLTFLVHAGLLLLFGRVYWPHLAYTVFAGGCGTVLTWRLLLWVLEPLRETRRPLAAILSLPLVPLGVYAIYPHPIYDSDAILAVLLALCLLKQALGAGTCLPHEPSAFSIPLCFVAGGSCVIPIFFKQNIGGPFLAAALATIAVLLVQRWRLAGQKSAARELWVVGGAASALSAAVLSLQIVVGLGNYLHWTVQFAAQRRLPGLAVIVSAYQQSSLAWALPCAAIGCVLLYPRTKPSPKLHRIAAIVLLAAPFLWTLASLWINTDPDDRADQLLSLWAYVLLISLPLAALGMRRFSLRSAMPWILLATIHGTFLSQQLWGSTYAMWPLLLLLLAGMLVWAQSIAIPLAITASVVLTICGSVYAASFERLSYIHLDGAIARSSLPALRGLATPGPWLPGFDELVRFTNTEIPADQPILLVPGEDPFFFATGRVPEFPVLLFDPATYPYSPTETVALARAHGIEWLIVKRQTQLTAAPYDALPAITAGLLPDFVPYRRLTLYDVYRRR